MPSLEGEIEFEAYCDQCGAGLCGNVTVRSSRKHGMPQILLEPCAKCLESATDAGREEAEQAAYERGFKAGTLHGKYLSEASKWN